MAVVVLRYNIIHLNGPTAYSKFSSVEFNCRFMNHFLCLLPHADVFGFVVTSYVKNVWRSVAVLTKTCVRNVTYSM
jgi:hypothetical protein